VNLRLREGLGEVDGLVPGLPRALRALAREAVDHQGPALPYGELGAVAAMCGIVVLVGHATRVP
jgi:hypothetical protein